MKIKSCLKALGLLALLAIFVLGTTREVVSFPSPQGPPIADDRALIDQLDRGTDGQLRISYHTGTGKVRFIGTDFEHAVSPSAALAANATPDQAARQFLAIYGQLFGLVDQRQELTVTRATDGDRGRSFIRFQQVYQGIPVMGGELVVQMDNAKNVMSASGEVLPEPQVDTAPLLDAETALERALTVVAKEYDLDRNALTATAPELWIYSPVLLGGPGITREALVWRIEVRPAELLPIREMVLVDAHRGSIALHFDQIDSGRNRHIYDNNNNPYAGLPGTGPARSEGQGATGIADVDKAYDFVGDTYDFYLNNHRRDSLDNAGMALISTVRYCPNEFDCPYENAFWDGQQMVYGQGFASADDVVGHEMTHGVTEKESHLFYYMQSGAINEAFSDIWGEFIDLTNGKGDDSTGVRWLMGEDLSIGAIRSMSNPPAYGDPDRIGSANYYCGDNDGGGVHWNSGIANKAAYLMVDGGTFNGQTITGIGITRTAKIWYEVQTNMFTSAGEYQDLYDDLVQAALNLVGTGGITAADVDQVKKAVDATEMNQQPSSCPSLDVPLGPAGQSPINLFFDDLENPASGNWTSLAIVGLNAWYYPQTANPYGFDATYATSGRYNFWGYDRSAVSDIAMAMTNDVTLPSGGAAYLHFKHAYDFEKGLSGNGYDGGVVEYSTDSGATWVDAGPLFTDNGYNGTIYSGSGNPLGNRQAFTGPSRGYLSSRVDLTSLAGNHVRFRFRIGTDSSVDSLGWFLDDVRIYRLESTGSTTTPTATTSSTPTATSTATASKTATATVTATATSSRTATPVARNVELVGQAGGSTGGVSVKGNYAYLGVGPRLETLNVSDRAHPVMVGQSAPLSGLVRGIAIAGNYAYVATGSGGLRILNIINLSDPVEVGYYDTPGSAVGVAVAGNYAYVADGDGGLRIIDVTSPTSPIGVGSRLARAWDVAISGAYAYVREDDGVHIVDVANPASPVEVGLYQPESYPPNHYPSVRSLAVSGSYLYVVETSPPYYGALVVIDTSNPAHPSVAGQRSLAAEASRIVVAGSYAYVTEDWYPDGTNLVTIDVSNPASPAQVGARFTTAWGQAFVVADSYAYLTHQKGGLRILNLASPPDSAEVGSFDAPIYGLGVATSGSYAYVASGYNGLRVLDTTNPSSSTEVGFHDTPGYARGVALSGSYAYVADEGGGLRVVDVADPSGPTEVGAYTASLDARAVVARVGYVFVAGGYGGLRIIGVSNPASPTEVGSYDTPGYARGVALAGNFAYVADSDGGLRIISIADPANPTEVGFYSTPGEAWSVAVSGNHAYVAERQVWDGSQWVSGGLRIIAIANPTAPTLAGFYDTPGEAWSVVMAGNYAHVADGSSGLRVVDVRNASSPTEVGYYDTPGTAFHVAADSQYAYVADGANGLLILQFATSDSVTPTPTATATAGVPPILENHVYVPLVVKGYGPAW